MRFDPRNVFVGSWDGVYGTSDAGVTWNKLSSGLLGGRVVSLAAHPSVSGELFALGDSGRIFWSQDHALSWRILLRTPRITPLIAPSPAMLGIDAGSQALHVGSSGEGVFTLSPLEPRTVPAARLVPFRP